MSDSSYCLVFEGKIVSGQDPAEVKKRLQKVFKKDEQTIEKLFSGKKVKLKQGLNQQQADQYKAKMHSIGVLCEIESRAAKAVPAKTSPAVTQDPEQSAPPDVASRPETAAFVGSSTVANVAQTPSENSAKPVKLADIDKGFTGSVPKVDLPTSYKMGVVAMGVTMVLLPLLYIGLIGLLGYGVISHAVVNTSWLQSLGAKFGFIAYVTPIVAGVTIILFMVKPLFAPPAVKSKTVVLDSVKEPLLFHFVNKIATAVGAPRPKQIEVDCEVNASASFRKGLFSFMGDDLVLTIGMPLLAGFNTRQLAGVLAHEFGHFSQGVGMRFHYLAYKINSWFFYAVHARDGWDEKLDQLAERTESWASVILNFARGGVWLTRKLLHGFMVVGHLVSSYMLRQMELDADRYEAQVAGSEQFKDTTLRLQRLGAAYQVSHDYLAQAWEDKKLVNDFPSLVAHNASKLPEQLDQALLAQMEEVQTHVYDSHPSDKERIENAAAQQAKGLITLNRHSRELFKKFDYLAKQVSNLYYAHELGLDFDSSKLVDISQVVKIAHDNEKQQEAYRTYFKDMAPVFDLPLSVNIFDTSKTEWEDLLAQYREVNNQLADQIADRRVLMKKADECYTRYQHFSAIRDLEDAGFVLFPEWFDLTPEMLDASKKQKLMYEQAWNQSIEQLKPLFSVNDNRLSIALTLMNHPKAIEANPDHAHHLKTRNHLSLLVNNIKRNAETIVDFRNKHGRLLAFLSCAQAIRGQKQADVNEVRDTLLEELKQAAQRLTAALSRLDYPYVAEGEHQTISDYLETLLPRANQFSSELEFYLASGNIILEKLDAIYGRVISGLANVALTVDILVPYIEGRAEKPELETQPVIEQEEYVPAEVSEAELRAVQMAQAVGAESFNNNSTTKPVQPDPVEEKPKQPVKINVKEIKNPGTRSVFAIDETEDKSADKEAAEAKESKQTTELTADKEAGAEQAAGSPDKGEAQSNVTEIKPVQPSPLEAKPEQVVQEKADEKQETPKAEPLKVSDIVKTEGLTLVKSEPEMVAPEPYDTKLESKENQTEVTELSIAKDSLANNPVSMTSENSDIGAAASTAMDKPLQDPLEKKVEEVSTVEPVIEEPKVVAKENNDAGVTTSFALDESVPEPEEAKVDQPQVEETKIEARENKDAGVAASFVIDEAEPETQEVNDAKPKVEQAETKVEARENNDAGIAASFAIDETEPEPEEVKVADSNVEQAEAKVEARENNDAGVTASFTIDETEPEPEQAEAKVNQASAEEVKVEARENKDAGVTASFKIDESEPETEEEKVTEQKPDEGRVVAKENNDAGKVASFSIDESKPEPQSESSEPLAGKSSNPFLSRSAFATNQVESESNVTDSSDKAETLKNDPVSVVAKTPNPFLANVSTYQKKLAEEAESASLVNDKGDSATISMNGLNAGSTPASTDVGKDDATDQKDKLASFSTGGLSLEPMEADQEDETQTQKSNTANQSDPQSVVVEKPDVLSALENSKESSLEKAAQKFFESPGLPNNSPAEERGMRPEPPADPFATSGSELSLEDSGSTEQVEPKESSSDKPADRPNSH